MIFPSCAVVCSNGNVSLSVHASLTVVGKARLRAVILGVPFLVATVARAC